MFIVLGDAVPRGCSYGTPRWPRLRTRSSLGIPPTRGGRESRGCRRLREEGRTCPRTHCRPRNQVCGVLHALYCFAVCAWIEGSYRLMHACMSELLAPNIQFHRIYICFDCFGHPAVPCRVWHGKAGDTTRCGVSPRVLGRLLWFGTVGGSLLQWPIQMINEQVRPLL